VWKLIGVRKNEKKAALMATNFKICSVGERLRQPHLKHPLKYERQADVIELKLQLQVPPGKPLNGQTGS